MKQFIALAILCIGVANALPLLKTAVSRGVLLEERSSSTPTFAKGIRTDCNYEDIDDQDLGLVLARGLKKEFKATEPTEEAEHEAKKEALVACDDMGPDCAGVVRDENGIYRLFANSVLKKAPGSKTYLKEICAFPLPYSNFWKGVNHHRLNDEVEEPIHEMSDSALKGYPPRNMGLRTGQDKAYKFNHVTNPHIEGLRWKLSNGPAYNRIDDGKDHGSKSRLHDGQSEEHSIEDCMAACSKRTDCMSGHYCESGQGNIAGKCILSGDWDPYGIEPEYDGCTQYRNFRQSHEWVKPVLRTEDGEYIKEQWHSKTPIDVAYAQRREEY